jgi:voltage-gated potassium channel
MAWERAMQWPLLVAAVVFLIAYAVPILWPDLPHVANQAADLLAFVVWILFGVDYLARLALARERRKFIRGNLLDLALIAPPLRPLRLLRLLRLVVVLSVVYRRVQMSFRGRVLTYVVGSVILVVFLGSLAILDAERGKAHANVHTFGDALWWSMTTITTVGYGDLYPTSTEGRLVAVLLMLAGNALLGVITASLASWFVERLRNVERAEERTQAALAEVLTELRVLRHRLDHAAGAGPVKDERA